MNRRVLWVSTSTKTRGGVATYVRTMQASPLWGAWDIRHVATHRNGSAVAKVGAFAIGTAAFLREMVVRRPAVVHLHSSVYGSFARKSVLAWLARAAGVPIVLHVHGGAFSDFYARSPKVVQRYIRATLTGADRVVALGKTWARALHAIAPDARLAVVPNAVIPRTLVDQPGADEPVGVLFVGDLIENKGTFVLLEAWQRLSDGSSAELTLVGTGDDDRVRRTLAELGLSGRVRLTGWVPPSEVEGLLDRSHVLVLPSRFEGQPMAVLEAMAHGLCVVATAVGGIPDLVDEECGVLVPPDDVEALAGVLNSVISDSEKRTRLGAAALARVRERFDVDRTWRELDSLYEELTR